MTRQCGLKRRAARHKDAKRQAGGAKGTANLAGGSREELGTGGPS